MTQQMNEALRCGLDTLAESVAEVKPKLRGWMHAATAPLTLAGGIVLVILSPTPSTRVGLGPVQRRALVLFTVSAVYHTGSWSPRVWAFLRRFDHANIFVLIAGSYTPLTLILLEGTQRHDAADDRLGLRSRACSSGCSGPTRRAGCTPRCTSRWAGWPSSSSPRLRAGRLRAARRRRRGPCRGPHRRRWRAVHPRGRRLRLPAPEPPPRWFGFHEVFHTFTILAFVTHYVGISMATYALR